MPIKFCRKAALRLLPLLCLCIGGRGVAQSIAEVAPYRNPTLSVVERTEDLLARMTVAEKVRQLQCLVFQDVLNGTPITADGIGGMAFIRIKLPLTLEEEVATRNEVQRRAVEETRLGIPILFHAEALHGLVDRGATSFPQAIGMAASWNPELLERVATQIATETRARGFRQVLSPTVDIARDVRWGRVAETYGEDPGLVSRMAVAFTRPFETTNIITTLKHFVANSGPGGRDSHPVHHSERELREVYFPPYRAAIQEAGVRSVMAAYGALDGIPAGTNRWLLTDVLRGEWGFEGTVVTDYGLLGRLYRSHGTAADGQDAAVQALRAGLDRDLPRIGPENTFGELTKAVASGQLDTSYLNRAVRRLLRQKFALGLFEQPYTEAPAVRAVTNTPPARDLAREMARESLVLLRNKGSVLPLDPTDRILVLGRDAVLDKLGDYSPWDIPTVTLLDGLRAGAADPQRVTYLPLEGQGLVTAPPVPGEYRVAYFTDAAPEVAFRTDSLAAIDFNWGSNSPSPDRGVVGAPFRLRAAGAFVAPAGGPVAFAVQLAGGLRLRIDGEEVFDNYADPYTTEHRLTLQLEAGKTYAVEVDYRSPGQYSRLQFGWYPAGDTQVEAAKTSAAAAEADAIVVVAGVQEKEGQDRADLDLPATTEAVIRAAAATGKPVVVVLTTGSAVTMNDWHDEAGAILQAWYPGQEGGTAMAEAIFGRYNPGGKLPLTFPYDVAQCPLYYNYKPSGRGYGYVNMTGEPRYPFGHGLSYTTFGYGQIESSVEGDSVVVRVTVRNDGPVDGDEVVQLYLRDPLAEVVRPVKELKGFRRVAIPAGTERTVRFTLSATDLTYLGADLQPTIGYGQWDVMVGSSSGDIRLRDTFTFRSPGQ